MKKVLITGASGLVGSYLQRFLRSNGYETAALSRKKHPDDKNKFQWDLNNQYIEKGALENSDFIVHLAGAGIADKRWTDDRKKEIINSRVDSADLLLRKIKETGAQPEAFISASAIGYYGTVTSDKIFVESDPPGNDFQAEVCDLWEKAAAQFSDTGIRTVQLRFGIVLSPEGGALKKMLLPTKLGLGSPLGSGHQYFPWVHIKDIASAVRWAITNDQLIGPYNIVAPEHLKYEDFSKTLAKVLHRPHFVPNVPAFLLKAIFGEMAQIILEGSRISSKKINSTGFEFEFQNLEDALKDLLSQKI